MHSVSVFIFRKYIFLYKKKIAHLIPHTYINIYHTVAYVTWQPCYASACVVWKKSAVFMYLFKKKIHAKSEANGNTLHSTVKFVWNQYSKLRDRKVHFHYTSIQKCVLKIFLSSQLDTLISWTYHYIRSCGVKNIYYFVHTTNISIQIFRYNISYNFFVHIILLCECKCVYVKYNLRACISHVYLVNWKKLVQLYRLFLFSL